MSTLECAELNFLLDRDGSIIAFQERDQSWAGALAFSSEELARRFVATSRLEVAEVAAVALDDHTSLNALITALKKRPTCGVTPKTRNRSFVDIATLAYSPAVPTVTAVSKL